MSAKDIQSMPAAQRGPRWTDLRDVWVLVEALPGGLSPADQGAIARARELADLLGCYARVLALGAGGGEQAIALGADSVALAQVPEGGDATAALRAACEHLFTDSGPEFVLAGLSPAAERLAPALAETLGGALAAPCLTLSLDDLERVLTVKLPAYDGLYRVPFTFRAGRPQVAVLAPDAQGVPYPDEYRSGDVQTLPLENLGASPLQVLGPAEYTPPAMPITHAQALVVVGRALGDEAGLELARRLAELLGADLAGDRSARELGWVDDAHTVGLTGEVVAPALYVALGVRGDTEHFFGMLDSRTIVALHPDAHAPIFRHANIAWTGDVKEGLRALIAALEA